MIIEKRLKEAVTQLYYWQEGGGGTNFHSILYLLFQKADPRNFHKLSIGFPEEAEALILWYNANDNGNELFKVYGLLE